MSVIVGALVVVVLTRLGLLAFVVAIGNPPDPGSTCRSRWIPAPGSSRGSVMTMALFAAVAVYGFVVSLGGKLRFTAAGLEDGESGQLPTPNVFSLAGSLTMRCVASAFRACEFIGFCGFRLQAEGCDTAFQTLPAEARKPRRRAVLHTLFRRK